MSRFTILRSMRTVFMLCCLAISVFLTVTAASVAVSKPTQQVEETSTEPESIINLVESKTILKDGSTESGGSNADRSAGRSFGGRGNDKHGQKYDKEEDDVAVADDYDYHSQSDEDADFGDDEQNQETTTCRAVIANEVSSSISTSSSRSESLADPFADELQVWGNKYWQSSSSALLSNPKPKEDNRIPSTYKSILDMLRSAWNKLQRNEKSFVNANAQQQHKFISAGDLDDDPQNVHYLFRREGSNQLENKVKKQHGLQNRQQLHLNSYENCVVLFDVLADRLQRTATATYAAIALATTSKSASVNRDSHALELRIPETCSDSEDPELAQVIASTASSFSPSTVPPKVEFPDPHAGMILTTARNQVYELIEPIELELGSNEISHVRDYAFTPVLSSQQRPGLPSTDNEKPDNTNTNSEQNDYYDYEGGDESANTQEEEKVLEDSSFPRFDTWWQWWLPRWSWGGYKSKGDDEFLKYKLDNRAFAGGSHGEVWRGKRNCIVKERLDEHAACGDSLIFKRLKVERGYRILEAGLREVHFGSWLAQEDEARGRLFTRYVDHFFRQRPDKNLELWVVFQDAGPSLRSYLYAPVTVGDLVVYQQSALWTKLRLSVSPSNTENEQNGPRNHRHHHHHHNHHNSHHHDNDDERNSDSRARGDSIPEDDKASSLGRHLMVSVFRQILEAAAFLHSNGVVHRDIKPSNVMCKSFPPLDPLTFEFKTDVFPTVLCVLGDLSSAWNDFTNLYLYTRGPSRAEQTDEYAPPEAIFGYTYRKSEERNQGRIQPTFDSWSIGILGLEILLGTPNVFSVDQRTRAILTHKLEKEGASHKEIERALYLAALSQFCIYSPTKESWPLRTGDPLHNYAMVKSSCTIHDFHRAIRARDPLGRGFDSSADTLLHLLWQLLAWDPDKRMTASEALMHPFFSQVDSIEFPIKRQTDFTALENQTLDHRMYFNSTDTVSEFRCNKCGRIFSEWNSCKQHTLSRKHGKFCSYDKTALPTCLSAHSLLPAHASSGYCDIQGRRRVIEDFHSIHLDPVKNVSYYLIADGHCGNLASKYVASFLYEKLFERLGGLTEDGQSVTLEENWKDVVERNITLAFNEIHEEFLATASRSSHVSMDQSGTTATVAVLTQKAVVVACLGDSRAVLAATTRESSSGGEGREVTAVQLTVDHVAADQDERALVTSRGGFVAETNGVHRVNGVLAITRSIGDAGLSQYLSRDPQVVSFDRSELKTICGNVTFHDLPCFLILASDGLWDTMSNQEAVDLASSIIATSNQQVPHWSQSASLQDAAEALTIEAYVRGSKDNIGVAIVALDDTA